jgi:hypothetical protein
MIRLPRWAGRQARLPILLIAVLALLPAPALALKFQAPQRRPADDTDAFRYLLSWVLKCEPLADVEDLQFHARDGVLVVLGDTTWMDANTTLIQNFVLRGGRVLIASDRDSADAVSNLFSIRIIGLPEDGPLFTTNDVKNDGYRGQMEDCPVLRASNLNKSYPFFQNIERIATNRPGALRQRNTNAKPIAQFPASCALEDNTRPVFAMVCDRYDHVTPVLVLSDHSVFINSMMLQPDNDNFAFAYKCLRWLTDPAESGGARRTKVLLMDDGNPVKSFEVKVREVPATLPGSLDDLPAHPVDIANALLGKWEDENIHNELIFGRYSGSQILSGIVIAATVLLLAWLFFRVQQALHRTEAG